MIPFNYHMTCYNFNKLLSLLLILTSVLTNCNNRQPEHKQPDSFELKEGIVINLVGVGCSGCEESLLDMVLKTEIKSHIILPDSKLQHIKKIKKIKHVTYEIINTTSELNMSVFPYVQILYKGKKNKIEIKTSEMDRIKMSILQIQSL